MKAKGKPPFSVNVLQPSAATAEHAPANIALGITDGGRRILVIFSFTDENGVRPIAAWERA